MNVTGCSCCRSDVNSRHAARCVLVPSQRAALDGGVERGIAHAAAVRRLLDVRLARVEQRHTAPTRRWKLSSTQFVNTASKSRFAVVLQHGLELHHADLHVGADAPQLALQHLDDGRGAAGRRCSAA
jgi:hypothetical protein